MSINNIWLKLSNSEIGFFTYETRNNIPASGGVYAWILPIKFNPKNKDTLTNSLKRVKKIQSYDSKIENHSKLTKSFPLNWEPFDITLKKNDEAQTINESHIKTLEKMNDKSMDILQKSVHIGSLFSRPLYIGYTNQLNRRYYEHVNGDKDNSNFHNRFINYINLLKEEEIRKNSIKNDSNIFNLRIEDLLFVSLKFEESQLKVKELRLLEEILKTLANPIFSKI